MTRNAGIPASMHAVVIDRFGGPEVMKLRALPVPTPGPSEVLIAVHTAGVAVWDAEMREGWSPTGRTCLPFVLGTDGSGTVAAVGSRVRRFAVGDRVFASSFDTGGFYAEYVSVSADTVAHVPDGLGLRVAGAIPITGVTALQGINDALRLRRDEVVVIHGAAGGVGSLAVQFASYRGARVIASVSGRACAALVKTLGASEVIDTRRMDVAASASRLAPQGIDAVLALAGGSDLKRWTQAVRRGGRLAYPRGVEPVPTRRSGIRIIPFDGFVGIAEFARLNRALQRVPLQIPIARRCTLANATKAHRLMAAGHVTGKIVLEIR